MPNNDNADNLKTSTYTITKVDMHITVKDTISMYVSTTLTYHMNPTDDNYEQNITLRGQNLRIIQVLLNDNEIDTEKYQVINEKILVIHSPPPTGEIKIKTHVLLKSLFKVECSYYNDDVFIFHGKDNQIERLTFFFHNAENLALYTTTITAPLDTYQNLIANGRLIKQSVNDNQTQTMTWQDAIPKSSDVFMLAFMRYSHAVEFVSSENNTGILLNLYSPHDKAGSCNSALKILEKYIKWHISNQQETLPQQTYSIVTLPINQAAHLFAHDICVVDTSTYSLSHTIFTDSIMIANTMKIVEHYLLALSKMQPSITASEIYKLRKDFAEYYFTTNNIDSYIDRYFKLGISKHNNDSLLEISIDYDFFLQFRNILLNDKLSHVDKIKLLTLPTITQLIEHYPECNFEILKTLLNGFEEYIANNLKDIFLEVYTLLDDNDEINEFDPKYIHIRKLKNLCLKYLCKTTDMYGIDICYEQILNANNVNDRHIAFEIISECIKDKSLSIYNQCMPSLKTPIQTPEPTLKSETLLLAVLHDPTVYQLIFNNLENNGHIAHDIEVMLTKFSTDNFDMFHASHGKGYTLLVSMIIIIQNKSTHCALKLLQILNIVVGLDVRRKRLVLQQLNRIDTSSNEIISCEVNSLYNKIINTLRPRDIIERCPKSPRFAHSYNFTFLNQYVTKNGKNLPAYITKEENRTIALVQLIEHHNLENKKTNKPAVSSPQRVDTPTLN